MTAMTDVAYRTSRPRISASGWLYLPAATVLQRYRCGQAVDELVITVDGPTEDRACESGNELLFELTRGGCVELDRDDQTIHQFGRRSSFTVTVSPAGQALQTLLDEGYHITWDADAYSAAGVLAPVGTPAPTWDD